MTDMLDAAWLAARLTDRTARGIAVETTALIRSGAIAVGVHLPPVRDLAAVLGVSPATISAAWSALRRYKVISGRGRGGVWVCGDKVSPRPARFKNIGNFGEGVLDLTSGLPDPALLPDLAQALSYGARATQLHNYQREPITVALRDAVQARWPYAAESFMATNGGFEAVYIVVQTLLMPGAVVAVENPTALRLLDILENAGMHVVPVACDDEGPTPASLAEALRQRPAAFIYQPRTHAVTGRVVSARRRAQMATLLNDTDTLIIEDDGIGDVSSFAPASLGSYHPDRTVHILSFSKSLGPDLRLGVLSCTSEMADQLQAYRSFGAGWTSRILQTAAAWLLQDRATAELLAGARAVYAQRRWALVQALRARGVAAPDGDGLCLWLPVPSEQFAMVTLAARRIAVMPGSKCWQNGGQHIRVGTSLLRSHADMVADAISLACPEDFDTALNGQPVRRL